MLMPGFLADFEIGAVLNLKDIGRGGVDGWVSTACGVLFC